MAVCLQILDPDTRLCAPLWSKFMDHLHSCHPGLALEDSELKAELEKYHAWTDWNNDLDPIWFEDQSSLVQFVLAWS